MKFYFDLIRRIEQEDDISERRALADTLHRSLAFVAGDGRDPIMAGVRLFSVNELTTPMDIEARTGVPVEHVRDFRREHARLVGEVAQ